MNRRVSLPLIAAAFAVAAAVAVSAATHVTFVFKNGTEKSGEFSYHHDTNYNLIINGAEQVFPSDDIALINPNTRNCPTFRTRTDAELTLAIYRRVPIFGLRGDEIWILKIGHRRDVYRELDREIP